MQPTKASWKLAAIPLMLAGCFGEFGDDYTAVCDGDGCRASAGAGGGGGVAGSTGGSGGAGGSTTGCGYGSKIPACDSCLTSMCCEEGTTCKSNSECAAIFTCDAGCTNDSCRNDCGNAHPAGTSDYLAFSKCLSSKCTSPCGAAVTLGMTCNESTTCQCLGTLPNPGICSAPCTKNADCAPASKPMACINDSQAGKACLPKCTGSAECATYGWKCCSVVDVAGSAALACSPSCL